MEPMYLSIQQKKTGKQIKKLLMENGYTVKDVQNVMGFENPQAIYKWISGRSLPSLDNFIILSRLLHTSIEDILVIDGDIVRLRVIYFKLLVLLLVICYQFIFNVGLKSDANFLTVVLYKTCFIEACGGSVLSTSCGRSSDFLQLS